MLEGPYRVGPWPGLTPSGAGVLLGCALLLGVAAALTGDPRRAMPDLPILALSSLAPLLVATRIVNAPGAASAVSGAYLLPRALISLLDPAVQAPPLLLVPALALDLTLWLRAADVHELARAWPGRTQPWRKRESRPWRKRESRPTRRPGTWRRAAAGAVFGLALSLVEPPFAVLLGADPATWSASQIVPGAVLAVVGCALLSAGTGLARA